MGSGQHRSVHVEVFLPVCLRLIFLMSRLKELQSRRSAPVRFFINLALKYEDNFFFTGNVGHRTEHAV